METVKTTKSKQPKIPKTPNFGSMFSKILKNMIYANLYDTETIVPRTVNGYDIRNYHNYESIMSSDKIKLRNRVNINNNASITIDCLLNAIITDIKAIMSDTDCNKDNYIPKINEGITRDLFTSNIHDTMVNNFGKCLMSNFSDNSDIKTTAYCSLVQVLLVREVPESLEILAHVTLKLICLFRCISWYISQVCIYDKKHTMTIQNNIIYASLRYCGCDIEHINQLFTTVDSIIENKASLKKMLKK